jgi:hypothetical protein
MISWNIPNWITVMLMAAAGYAVLGAIRQAMMYTGGGGGAGGGQAQTPQSSLGGY